MATRTAERTTNQAPPRQAPTGNLPAARNQQQAPVQQDEAKKPPAIVQFRDYVQARMATLEDALPPTIPPKRFVSVLMTALQNKPTLLTCTFPSLWNACVRAAQDGLLPDGREGAIAPYGENKDGKRVAEIATWMPMVEGYRKKIFEAGKVKSWTVEVVHEKDDFDYELGDNAYIRHKPFFGAGNPGNVVGAYSIAKLESGEIVREVMSAFKIAQVQAKSKAGNGPWKDAAFFPEMCKKVVARRHYKQLPHSESMDAMIARDDRDHGLIEEDTPRIPEPVTARRLTHREAFDTYASGDTIDHETGEVLDGDDEFQADDVQQSTASAAPSSSGAKGAAATPSTKQAGAPTTNAAKSEASKEANAQGSASTSASTAQSEQDQRQELPAQGVAKEEQADETEQRQGEQRGPRQDDDWDITAEPTDVGEYEHYLRAVLKTMTDPSKVAPWWNSKDQKELRERCAVGGEFKRLQDIAVEHRKSLENTSGK
jgi:recombination protein RecT